MVARANTAAVPFHPLLKDTIELHCHSYPSIFPRSQTAWELIEDVKTAGMAGIVLKSHETQTIGVAELIREKEPDLYVFGGLVCNYFTGGLSPYAVDVAIRSGAKVIWMPTISSQEHLSHFSRNKKGKFFNSKLPLVRPDEGLAIWDRQERILPNVHEILQLIAEADIMLATGHLSPKEVIAVVSAAKEHGIQKILIQHVDLGIAPLSFDLQSELVKKGAFLEKCYLACSKDFKDLSPAQMANSIHRLGADSCVLVTDYGQQHNIPPVHALNQFVGVMLEQGVSEKEIKRMLTINTKQLLGI